MAKKEKHTTMRIPFSLFEQYERLAKEKGESLNQLYKRALVDFIVHYYLD